MDASNTDRPPVIVEPVTMFDTLATGILPPQDCGAFVRLLLYADRPSMDGTIIERVLVGRFMLSKPDFHAALIAAAKGSAKSGLELLWN